MQKTDNRPVVAAFPSDDPFNPYLSLLYTHLEAEGVGVAEKPRWRVVWLLANREKVSVLHLHWLDHLHRKGLFGTGLFLFRLTVARTLGYKIVWTMHNYLPHERNGRLARLVTLAVGEQSHAIVAHCLHGQKLAERLFRRSRGVYAIPHGNYVDVYPDEMDREEAREHLNLPQESLVYLYFGQVRSYKGIGKLARVFQEIESPGARLVIVGQIVGEECRQELERAASADGRISLHFGHVPDQDVQHYFKASDVVVLPYLNVLTSGTVILALSFARPVIVPRAGCLPEVVGSEAGLIYDGLQEASLLQALREAQNMDLSGASEAAGRRAEELDWVKVARRHREVYVEVLNLAVYQTHQAALS